MSAAGLFAHLATGSTHICQCWAITRADGVTFGFTDHDRPLAFDGITFLADSGLSARALALSSGLAVDNSEAVGLLQNDVIAEADIVAGRYDGAEMRNWLVRWDSVGQRQLRFRGRVGEITRQAGQFRVELRGLTDALNQPSGRTYLRSCSAVLGDAACGVDTDDPAFAVVRPVLAQTEARELTVAGEDYTDRWFEQGVLEVVTGKARGLTAAIKHDRLEDDRRRITLWQALRADVRTGDTVRLIAGCDKRAETCRVKFTNLVNFRGFPDMPGDDWMTSVPRSDDAGDGGSLVR
ncbi:phage conserved hypothetical protein BR0599 [Loktanella atrilutea]|uniref:Bacteriophage phiJL001 Gp84 C-terminal domain-containing protein n=1 Tax=Loktanella atrilutea TaxID=366533 RepID=A0A1M4U1H6_LOKAT|nr:DUF2163 domain-containing protein [Loktanella atrilutea]SHE50424.1 phage conserved hypothetical protein BR0599 [Loktanella atrilutea]